MPRPRTEALATPSPAEQHATPMSASLAAPRPRCLAERRAGKERGPEAELCAEPRSTRRGPPKRATNPQLEATPEQTRGATEAVEA
eukprot:11331665-Alexandrium_andersonii.AAC.1